MGSTGPCDRSLWVLHRRGIYYANMEYRMLGATGIEVSEFCLGAMMYGAMGNADHDDCIRQINTALDAGINFIDTADVYSQGESETIVGEAITTRRDDVVLATKFFGSMGPDRNQKGGSRRWITRAVEDSLRRLNVDHIDLYQIHRFPEANDIEETLATFTDLQRAGKIRSFGASMFQAERHVEAQWTSERMGLGRIRCEQLQYNIFTRVAEFNVIPTCQRYGIGVICWSPLAGGWLTGRYRNTADLDETARPVRFARNWGAGFDPEAAINQEKLALVGALGEVADQAGLPMTHLATAFTLEHPGVTSTIIGPRTAEQLADSLAAVDVRLDADTLDAIDAIVAPGRNVNASDPSSEPSSMRRSNRRR